MPPFRPSGGAIVDVIAETIGEFDTDYWRVI